MPLNRDQMSFLKSQFPGEESLFAPEEAAAFGADASRAFAQPWAVVRPRTLEQARELLSFAHRERIPLFPRGRATNVVGDCVPQGGGIVVSTLFLDSLEVDPEDFVAVAGPGVVTSDLAARAEARGLFYPPDPASVRISTIGGNVATCAGGMRALKYGVTRDFVLGLTAVLPGGQVITCGGRTHKNVAGLDLARLLVGSEGTLAFITQIILKLLPKPEATASVLAGFASEAAALAAARAVFAGGMLPAALEFMGSEVLECLARHTAAPWPKGTAAALLLRLDGTPAALAADLDRLTGILRGAAATHLEKGLGNAQEEPLWELRRLINPASFSIKPDKISDDVTVPRGKLAAALAGIRQAGARAGVPILVFGHLGDGNLHVNVMYDAAAGETGAAQRAKSDILDLVLALGGTMSGEHGIGLTKAAYLPRQIGQEELALMRRIKDQFDPHHIMNPGKAY
jgi:D-lactate dehydrogenase (cytochrome)/glycolate oxidase